MVAAWDRDAAQQTACVCLSNLVQGGAPPAHTGLPCQVRALPRARAPGIYCALVPPPLLTMFGEGPGQACIRCIHDLRCRSCDSGRPGCGGVPQRAPPPRYGGLMVSTRASTWRPGCGSARAAAPAQGGKGKGSVGEKKHTHSLSAQAGSSPSQLNLYQTPHLLWGGITGLQGGKSLAGALLFTVQGSQAAWKDACRWPKQLPK